MIKKMGMTTTQDLESQKDSVEVHIESGSVEVNKREKHNENINYHVL